MDALILRELVSIRWLLVAILVSILAVLIVVVWFTFFAVRAQQENRKGSFYGSAKALLDSGRLDELLAFCDERLRQYPADATAYWLLGNAHYRLRNLKRALDNYQRANDLQPGLDLGPIISEIKDLIKDGKTTSDLKIVAAPPATNAGSRPPNGQP